MRALFSAVSRGTEALVFGGRVPESEWPRMRAPFQAGDFPAPVKYGYMVGDVDRARDLVGAPCSCCTRTRPATSCPPPRCICPDGVPPARAVLAANLETAINGVWDADRRGDRVAVIGGGTVGSSSRGLPPVAGCEVELVDVMPGRAPGPRARRRLRDAGPPPPTSTS